MSDMAPVTTWMIENSAKHFGLHERGEALNTLVIKYIRDLPISDTARAEELKSEIDSLSRWLADERLHGESHVGVSKLIAGAMCLWAWTERLRYGRMERMYYDEINLL